MLKSRVNCRLVNVYCSRKRAIRNTTDLNRYDTVSEWPRVRLIFFFFVHLVNVGPLTCRKQWRRWFWRASIGTIVRSAFKIYLKYLSIFILIHNQTKNSEKKKKMKEYCFPLIATVSNVGAGSLSQLCNLIFVWCFGCVSNPSVVFGGIYSIHMKNSENTI